MAEDGETKLKIKRNKRWNSDKMRKAEKRIRGYKKAALSLRYHDVAIITTKIGRSLF